MSIRNNAITFATTCMLILLSTFAHNIHAQEIELLPPKNLFDAPIADPRWPKFLMGLSRNIHGNFGKSLWTFNFGENIGLAKYGSDESPYEVGVQAAVFGFMDISSTPTRLINTDYFVATGLSHIHGNWQHLFQLSHVSSHLGDELLLSDQGQALNRINLSYETAKWFVRYKSHNSFSPYAAIGYILHVDPSPIKRLSLSGGVDYTSSKFIFDNSTRFIAGLYVNAWQENKYKPTTNIRFGLQYERTKYCNRFLQLLIEYKRGKSQQGQFYRHNVQQIGILVAFSS